MEDIASIISRFPVKPIREIRYNYVCVFNAYHYLMTITNHREMYHGRRWMDDKRFFTPMINSNVGHIFVNDFVKVHTSSSLQVAKVKMFFKKVCFYTEIKCR